MIAPSRLPLTKLLSPEDYLDPELDAAIKVIKEASPGQDFNVPTPHRMWEYGNGLRAASIAERSYTLGAFEGCPPFSILEIGGGTSTFMPGLARKFPDAALTEVETKPSPIRDEMAGRPVRQLTSLPAGEEFDFVACVSAIENWEPALGGIDGMGKMAASFADHVGVGGVLYLTSDIGPSEPDTYHFHWMRPDGIWTPSTWRDLGTSLMIAARAAGKAFEYVGPTDFKWYGAHVWDYSFACMTLRRTK